MAMRPPDYESWAWEPLETVEVAVGSDLWIVALALAAQPEGWYVRVSRLLGAAKLARDLLLDGPSPDRASAAVSALGLIADAVATAGRAITDEHRNGRPPD
jgi:hypothetical protein